MDRIGHLIGVYIFIKMRFGFGQVERFEEDISNVPEIT